MGKIQLIELQKGDYPKASELASLARTIWTEHFTPIIGLEQVEYMLKKFQSAEKILFDMVEGGYRYFIAMGEEGMVGYCAIRTNHEAGGLFLSKFYIKKSCRGQGFSRIFLELLKDIAKEYGHDHIWLTVNKQNCNSIEVYKKLGFSIEEEIVIDIGSGYFMDDYKMRLDMADA